MGYLLIESASNNNPLIISMTQGQNRYPNIKSTAINMLCKYVSEHIKNKNNSTTICNRLATGVSFYQRATPINGPPVAETNGIAEDIITFCKCSCRSHIYPLFPKADDKVFQGMKIHVQARHAPPIFRTIHSPFVATYWHRIHFKFHKQSSTLKEREDMFNNSVAVKRGNIVIHPILVVRSSPRYWSVLQPTVHRKPVLYVYRNIQISRDYG